MNAQTREWIELVRKRSSLVLALPSFHRGVKAVNSSLIALIESIRQKTVIGVMKKMPNIVKVTLLNTNLVMGGVSTMV